MMVTLRPRASRIAARDAAAIPLPSEETTPPVTNIYFVVMLNLKLRKSMIEKELEKTGQNYSKHPFTAQ
jgi:hypothetical protein